MFVAPTKPLVTQQVTACHETCGIPGRDSIELTGEVARSARIRYVSCVPYSHILRDELLSVE